MPDLVGEVYGSALSHPDARRPAARIRDTELAIELLSGFDVNGTETVYRDTPVLRAALAREVRRKMRTMVGELLALAIDNDTPSKSATMVPTRRVAFEAVSRGPPSDWARDLAIVHFIKAAAWDGIKLIAAYKLAAERFKLSVRSIRDVRKRYLCGK